MNIELCEARRYESWHLLVMNYYLKIYSVFYQFIWMKFEERLSAFLRNQNWVKRSVDWYTYVQYISVNEWCMLYIKVDAKNYLLNSI